MKTYEKFITSITESSLLRKNVVSSAWTEYKIILSKILIPLIFLFSLMKVKAISRTRINKQAEIGSPCLAPFCYLIFLIYQPASWSNNNCISIFPVFCSIFFACYFWLAGNHHMLFQSLLRSHCQILPLISEN